MLHFAQKMSSQTIYETFFACETQTLSLQHMLLKYAHEEAFGKHSKSVFLQCFPNVCYKHKTCVLKAEHFFENVLLA